MTPQRQTPESHARAELPTQGLQDMKSEAPSLGPTQGTTLPAASILETPYVNEVHVSSPLLNANSDSSLSSLPSESSETSSQGYSPEDATLLRSLLDQGRVADAWECMIRAGWQATLNQGPLAVEAGRVYHWLGAPRKAMAINWLNAKRAPESGRSQLFLLYDQVIRRGIWSAMEEMEHLLSQSCYDSETLADALSLKAHLLAQWRDFERAWTCQNQAESIKPERSWLKVQRAILLEMQDRLNEAEDLLADVLKVRPLYRAALEARAGLLMQLNRGQEAEDLLLKALNETQMGVYAMRLSTYYSEQERVDEALQMLDLAEKRMFLAEKETRSLLAGRRADLLLVKGDLEGARIHASQSHQPYHHRFAEKLSRENVAQKTRKRLPVEFVRQHHMTCAPATITALARHWGYPKDHLDIAQKICYDGTPHHRERAWAEREGFYTREFAVTYEAAKALIDRGVPFCLTTVDPEIAHLQAVVGYDDRTEILILRDPTYAHFSMMTRETLEQTYAASGPRGMVMLPLEEAWRLDGIELPDSAGFDHLYRIQNALENHRRDEAEKELKRLESNIGPSKGQSRVSWLSVWRGRLALAAYDNNRTAHRRGTQALSRLASKDPWADWSAWRSAHGLDSRTERLSELAKRASKDGPISRAALEYAELLSEDERELPRVEYLFRKALKYPLAGAAHGMSGLKAKQLKLNEAREASRLAACLEWMDEDLATAYFWMCRRSGKTDEGIEFLKKRVQDLQLKSSQPAQTLYKALQEIGETEEAWNVLEQAQIHHPDEGELLLFVSQASLEAGKLDIAERLCDQARQNSSELQWLRARARLCIAKGRLNEARTCWKQVHELDPLDMDAWESIMEITSNLDGINAVLKELDKAVEKFPHYVPLAELRIHWWVESRRPEVLVHLTKAVEMFPENGFFWRNLAIESRRLEDHSNAEHAARKAIEVAPKDSYAYSVLALLLSDTGGRGEVPSLCRKALDLDVDNVSAMKVWLSALDTLEEKRKALLYIFEEMKKQLIDGDTMRAFAETSRPFFDLEEISNWLEQARTVRPDLWQLWIDSAKLLREIGRTHQADKLIQEATERFHQNAEALLALADWSEPASEAKWNILARVQELRPNWLPIQRELARELDRKGETSEAISLIQKALKRSPRDAESLFYLSSLQWKQGQQEEAFENLRRGVKNAPDYGWAWQLLARWSIQLNRQVDALKEAQELTKNNPTEARSWLALTDVMEILGSSALEIADVMAMGLNYTKKSVSLHRRRAQALKAAGLVEEALEATRPTVFGKHRPRELRALEAEFHADAGNEAEAMRTLDLLLTDEPDYQDAVRHLLDWLLKAERFREAKRWAEHLVRLDPTDSTNLGYLGDSLREFGDAQGAMDAYEKSLKLSPSNLHSAHALIELCLESREIERAEAVLEQIRPFADEAFLLEKEMAFDVAWNRQESWREKLWKWLTYSGTEELLASPIFLPDEKPWSAWFEEDLKRAATQGLATHPEVLALWQEHQVH